MNIKRMTPERRIEYIESIIEGAVAGLTVAGDDVEFPILEVTWRRTRHGDSPQRSDRFQVIGFTVASTNGTSGGELIVRTPYPTRTPYRLTAISLSLIDTIVVAS